MMSDKNSKIILEDQESSFPLSKSRTKLNITFNRISFIFLFFYYFFNFYYSFDTSWFKKIK